MSIRFDSDRRAFFLETQRTSYVMQVGNHDQLLHLYYGRKIGEGALVSFYPPEDRGFSPTYYEDRLARNISPDVLPQEYTGCNVGDFRLSCISLTNDQGAWGADFCYLSHEIKPGKYSLEGLPAAHDEEDEAETLIIKMQDSATGLVLELLYAVFARQDVITRAARLINQGNSALRLGKVASLCLDLPFGSWDLIHFHGRHTMERQMQRIPLADCIQTVSSTRGASSHHHNPFVILCDPEAGETHGVCYGVMLAYSGNYRIDTEKTQTGLVRLTAGIHDQGFSWLLQPGESFAAPEAILTFTASGLEALSEIYHKFLLHNVCRSSWRFARRPILINNWEATYFDFDSDKIVDIAKKAATLGVEMMVLDDGWFGKRNDDNSGLGDWTVNTEKLPGGLNPLIERIHALGMKFGIWVEPEMVNEDSDLYRAHPDWALTLPDRKPAMGRNQLILDMGRKEVVDCVAEQLETLLENHSIDYVKWDMNRNMSDIYSHALPMERQGETAHRYMLGVYSLLERLTKKFPNVLFEGCAGGGGRFDAGMLAYFPQIWCSDDTDAIERLSIQYGSSFGYPISSMGAHVSACPNHQTGRTTPLGTRAVVAMSGTFGYELDLNKLSEPECQEVKGQIERFIRWSPLIQNGRFYRLAAPTPGNDFTAWQFVSRDGSESLFNLVLTHPRSNAGFLHLQLRGPEPDALYQLDEAVFVGCQVSSDAQKECGLSELDGSVYSGSFLMYAGITLPKMFGDYPAVQLHLTRVEK